MTPHKILNEYFGYDDFREGQLEIIEAILNEKNVLAVMPTGSGKSLCYQIPALMKERFSLVISPLISLMQDQVESLNKIKKTSAFINSSLDYSDTQKVLQNISSKKIKLLYTAPERLTNHEFIQNLKELKPYYLFVDEAHCISQWGHNFRPSYRNIKDFADAVGIIKISAFTATATPDVREDIIGQLEFKDPRIFVHGFERNNISLNVIHTKKKKERIAEILRQSSESAIIYTATRKKCEEVGDFLKLKNVKAEFYHGGLSNELRRIIQDDFIKNEIKVIVATNAFGMGIDKGDIDLVIHYNIPGTIESLYQEFGRCGRNGQESKHFLLYSDNDKFIQEYLIKLNNPDIHQIRACYDAVLDYHRIAFNTRTERVLEIDSGLQRLLEMKSIKGNLLNSIFVILEQAGYLKLADGIKSKSSFRFLLTKDKLKEYIKKLKNNDSKELLLNLIQYYGQTPFVREVIINYKEIMEVSGISIDKIKDNFERLNSVGVLDLIIPVEKSGVEMLRERTSSSQLILDKAEIEMRAGHSFDKLGKVIEYAFTKDCRFNYILRYFGEIKDDYSCGKCDNCREQNTESLSDEYLTEIIVRTFKEFQGGLTSSRLIGILTGKSKSQIAKSISTYGSCRHYSNDSIEKAINIQVSKNVIKVIRDKLFFQPLSDLFADNDKDIVTEEADYESTLELYNKLREERAAASKKFSQPQELICTDKTLREIARIKPKTASEFLQIRDINQRMFNKIGIEFLEVITDHLNRSAGGSKLSELPKHIAQTYKLIKKGYKLSDISNLLKLPESIVSLQIESIISYFPDENYRSLLTDKEFEEVEKVIHEYGTDEKTIKKRLPSKYSYAQIRVIKAVLGSSRP